MARLLASKLGSHDIATVALLLGLMVFFLFGGSSRGDTASLLIVRPVGAILFVCGLAIALRDGTLQDNIIGCLLLAWMVLVALQLVPLPPAMWSELPGREPVVAAYEAAGQPLGWKPVSLVPMATINAFFALTVPVAAFLMFLQSDPRVQRLALSLLLLLAGLSAMFGILQAASGSSPSLYPYRLSNNTGPIGFFPNRNHQAMVLAALIPMMLVLAETSSVATARRDLVRWLARIAGFAFVVVIIMTGARVGTMLGLLAFIASLYLTGQKPDLGRKKRKGPALPKFIQFFVERQKVFLPAAAIAILSVTFLFASGLAFERIASKDTFGDLRFAILPTIWEMIKAGFPFGFGFGTFPEVYEMFEPTRMMQELYINRAHNDWFEILIEGGVFAGILALAIMAIVVRGALSNLKRILQPRNETDLMLGASMIGMAVLLLGSLTDYPLRTPAAATVFAIFLAVSHQTTQKR